LNGLRVSDSIRTVSIVWRRAFVDAIIAPRRFRKVMPEFRRMSDMLVHPGIASLDPGQIPAHGAPVQLLSIDARYGGMPPQDLYALLRIVRWLLPKRIFEIGTFQGVTTAHMALNSDAEIFTLDLPRDLATQTNGYSPADLALLQSREEIGKRYRALNSNGRVHQLFGNSRTFDYAPYQGSMDLVLVDACHLFDYVMSDSRNAFKLLRETGAVLWHDFGSSMDVNRACKVLAQQHKIYHLEGTCLALHARGSSLVSAL
jgi:predicted O-methyltransferase YrrM